MWNIDEESWKGELEREVWRPGSLCLMKAEEEKALTFCTVVTDGS